MCFPTSGPDAGCFPAVDPDTGGFPTVTTDTGCFPTVTDPDCFPTIGNGGGISSAISTYDDMLVLRLCVRPNDDLGEDESTDDSVVCVIDGRYSASEGRLVVVYSARLVVYSARPVVYSARPVVYSMRLVMGLRWVWGWVKSVLD